MSQDWAHPRGNMFAKVKQFSARIRQEVFLKATNSVLVAAKR